MVQRLGGGGAKKVTRTNSYILIKDGTAKEGNAILQVQALKKQHIMINPFFTKVSFLSVIPQAKLNYTACHLQVTVEAIE